MQLDAGVLEADIGLFELGVDSLALTEAVAAVERRWQITVSRQKLFEEHNNARRLVTHLVDAISSRSDHAIDETTDQPAAAQQRSSTPKQAEPTPAAQPAGLSEPARAYLDGFSRDYVQRSAESRRQRETYGKFLPTAGRSPAFGLRRSRCSIPSSAPKAPAAM